MLTNQRKKNDIMGDLEFPPQFVTVSQLLRGCSVRFGKEGKASLNSSDFDRDKQRNKTKCHMKSGARIGQWSPAMIILPA